MRMKIFIFALLFFEIVSQKSEIACTKRNGEISCEFTVPEGLETIDLLGCLNDDNACIQAKIAIVQSKEELQTVVDSGGSNNKDEEKESVIATEVMDTAGESLPVTVAGQTYLSPWSQYGESVASALHQRPTEINSLEYGDWMLQFANSIRGDPSEKHWNPSSVDEAILIVKASIQLYDSLEQQGLLSSKFYIANGYMALGETAMIDPNNPQYENALEYFEIASKLFKYASIQKESLPGIEREDIELRQADAMVYIGVLSVEKQVKVIDVETGFLNGQLDDVKFLNGQLDDVMKAADNLERAITILRRLLQLSLTRNDVEIISQRRIKLANALQNYSAIKAMTSLGSEKSAEFLEEAILHYRDVLGDIQESNPEWKGVIISIAHASSSLSDTYLQVGKYDMAKSKYRQTMMWYNDYNLDPPNDEALSIGVEDTLLEETEKALKDYNSMLYGGQEILIPNNNAKPGDQIYESDFIYEAGLHSTLGALRMARNEVHLAINHFAEAIELYNRNPMEAGQAIGDVKLSLATAYFKQGDYELSSDAYSDAMEIYAEFVGEGKNPMTEGLESLLQEHGLDKETIQLLTGSIGGEVIGNVHGIEENSKESSKDNDSRSSETILLDLDAVKASLQNATAKE